jgi:hypothetical protein
MSQVLEHEDLESSSCVQAAQILSKESGRRCSKGTKENEMDDWLTDAIMEFSIIKAGRALKTTNVFKHITNIFQSVCKKLLISSISNRYV